MRFGLVLIALLVLTGCSGAPELPEVDFLSPTTAKIIYKGREYVLEKDAPPPEGFPFPYRFEDDGDLDLKIGGKWIEFDNPFDIELKTPKLFKRSKKAKTLGYKKKTLRRSKRSRRR
ncbi:MAG: hypothetical protein GXO20_06515 [Thermodesulfobacteria bacterium]|nr:hypothetical protein [Thermodesulfobacteriota bacterium]